MHGVLVDVYGEGVLITGEETELKSVKLPKSLKIIEDSAFDSTQISSVELPKEIGRAHV